VWDKLKYLDYFPWNSSQMFFRGKRETSWIPSLFLLISRYLQNKNKQLKQLQTSPFLFLSISADVIEAILGNDLSYDCFVLYSHILKLFYTISNRVYPAISKSPKQLCTYIVNKNEINLHSLWNMPENLVECLHFCLFLCTAVPPAGFSIYIKSSENQSQFLFFVFKLCTNKNQT
jgi:hypothetical protein